MPTTPGGNPAGNIKQAVTGAISSGQPLSLSTAELIAISPLPNLGTIPSVIDFAPGEDPLAKLGLYRIAALFPGVPLAQWLPADGLLSPLTSDNSLVAIDQMGFQVRKGTNNAADELVAISVRVALGPNRQGFKVDALKPLNITATLSHINFSVHGPFTSPFISALIDGQLTLGALNLDVTLDCPSMIFTATLAPTAAPPSFASLLNAFSLPTPSSFTNLLLSELQLSVMSRDASVEFQAQITTPKNEPFSILDGVLALDSLMIGLEYAQGTTSATIAAQLTVRDKLILGTVLTNDANGWSANAGLNLPATLAILGQPQATSLAFGDILNIMGLSLPGSMKSFLDHIALEALDGGVTIPASGATTYQLHVAFTTDWTLGGLSIATDTDVKLGDGSNTVVGSISIDGFEVDLEYDFAQGNDTLLTVKAPHLGGLQGTYDITKGTITLNATSKTSLGQLLADFVSIFVSGYSYTALPEPWDLLNDISVANLSVTITLAQAGNKVEIDYGNGKLGIPFLVGTVNGFGLVYDSSKPAGSRFNFNLTGDFPMLEGGAPSWDPTKPSQAPTAPGIGAAYCDIVLAALGQHIALPSPAPLTIEDAITDIVQIVGTQAKGGALPFSKDAGWMIGTRMILLGQIDARLVFADPQIYGIHIDVRDDLKIKGAPKSEYLDVLNGLSVEILYRKVSPTIGEYEGFLTLPDSIGKINMDAFEIQLPSLGVKVFTNGDFEIDIGYPHNGDFSHSAVIAAAEFYGSGGLLFGKLSGTTDDNLPGIYPNNNGNNKSGPPVGAFGNVIEIGLGVQLGIYREFSAGPLSASLGVLLQGIFQGTFAKFTSNPYPGIPQSSEEYYNVYASITIIGKLQGEIDLVIVSATLLVEITLSAAISAETRRQVSVPMSASVHVELTVSINCGFFTIHIHVGFSTTVNYTAQFGRDTWNDALWNKPPPAALAAPMAVRLAATRLAAGAPPASIAYPTLQCPALPLNLYVVPQLTSGLAGGAPQWIYVVQTALMSPDTPTPTGVTLSAMDDGSPANAAAKLITAWVLQGYQTWSRGAVAAKGTAPDTLYAGITVTADDLKGLTNYFHSISASGSSARSPNPSETQAFFNSNLKLTLSALQTTGQYGLAFFPLLPGSTVSADHATVTPPADANKLAEVLDDFVRVTVLAAVHGAQQVMGDNTPSMLLSDIYTEMEKTPGGAPSRMSSVIGNGTRFMLHGTRIGAQALYQITGQEASAIDTSATELTVTVANSSWAAWGLTSDHIDVQVGIPPNMFPAGTPSVSGGAVASAMPLTTTAQRQFNLSQGQPGYLPGTKTVQATIRTFPTSLLGVIGTPNSTYAFALQTLDDQHTVNPVLSSAFDWCATIAFAVRRVPSAGSTAAKPQYLTNVYELVGVQSDDLDVLEQIYNQRNKNVPQAIEIAYVETDSSNNSTFYIQPLDTKSFIFRNNISTQTNPSGGGVVLGAARTATATAIDPAIETFLARLLTGGLVNSGGFYLNYGASTPLPDTLFDSGGLAHLNLVVSITMPTGTGGTVLDGSINAIRTADQATGTATHLFAASQQLTDLQATVPLGTVGIRVVRPTPPPPPTPTPPPLTARVNYQATLDNLFHLVAFVAPNVVTANGKSVPINLPKDQFITGPLRDKDASTGTIVYQRLFDLLALTGTAWPDDPADLDLPAPPIPAQTLLANSPYAFVGGQLPVGFQWVDLYGNTLPANVAIDPPPPPPFIPIPYTDPVAGFADWPHLVYGYDIEGDQTAPVLAIKRRFNYTLPAQPWSASDTRRVNNLKRAYATIYHQLADIDVSFAASFLPSGNLQAKLPAGTSLAGQLKADIQNILAQIEKNLGAFDLPDLTFALPTNSGAYRNDVLFALTASLTFSRRSKPDPAFATQTTKLSPYAPQLAGDNKGMQSYRAFAIHFEKALPTTGMKILVGDADVPGGAQLWIMRCGDTGLSYSFGDPVAFAPLPLAYAPNVNNSLISRDNIGFENFNSTIAPNNKFKLTEPLTASQIDLDAALGDFLSKLEQFLAPECAIPALLHDTASPTAVDACIAVKSALATQLSNRVVSLANGTTKSAAAIDAYNQACRVSLTNFYDIDSIAQVDIKTNLNGSAWPPGLALNLYGRAINLTPPPAANNNVTIAPGKVTLTPGQSTPLALALTAHRKGEEAAFPLPATLQIDAFEDVTGAITLPDGKLSTGTWLRFVMPADSRLTFSQNDEIALPLRAYPRAPIITGQDFSPYTDPDAKNKKPTNPLASADEWSLDLSYRHVYVAEDTLNVTVTLNIGEKARPMMLRSGMPADDILDTLTQFGALYTSAGPDQTGVGAVLSALRQGTVPANLPDALAAFAAMAKHVLASLDVPIKPPVQATAPRSRGDDAGGYDFQFDVREGFDATVAPDNAPWQLNVVAYPPRQKMGDWQCPMPRVDIKVAGMTYEATPDPTTGTASFISTDGTNSKLMADKAMSVSERVLHVEPLSIIDHHNGRYAVGISRNAGSLVIDNSGPHVSTALPAPFIYRTPIVTAPDKVLPFIDNPAVIDITGLPLNGQPANATTLTDALNRLYVNLLTGLTNIDTGAQGSVQTVVTLTYPVRDNDTLGLPDRVLPIILDLPENVKFYPTVGDVSDLVGKIRDALIQWRTDNKLSDGFLQRCKLEFEVSVFSTISETGIPLIHHSGLYLQCSNVAWS